MKELSGGPHHNLYAVGIRKGNLPVIVSGGICFGQIVNYGRDIGVTEVLYPIRPLPYLDKQHEAFGTTREELISWYLNILQDVWKLEGIEQVPVTDVTAHLNAREDWFIRCFRIAYKSRIYALVRLTMLRYLEEQIHVLHIMYHLCQKDPERFSGDPEKFYHAFYTAHVLGHKVRKDGEFLADGHTILRFSRDIPYEMFQRTLQLTSGSEMQREHHNQPARVDEYTLAEILDEKKGYF